MSRTIIETKEDAIAIPVILPTRYSEQYIAEWNESHTDASDKIKHLDESIPDMCLHKGISSLNFGQRCVCLKSGCGFVARTPYFPNKKYGGIRCPKHTEEIYMEVL